MQHAQTLDQTFDQIGKRLEAAQQSLSNPSPWSMGAPPPVGTKFYVNQDAQVYGKPDPNAVTPYKLNAQTPLIFQGIENGFVKVTPPGSDHVQYLAYGVVDWAKEAANNQMKSAMEYMKGLAKDLQQNPYVRVKGFSVNVSLSPSFNIDFEMKEAAAPATK